MEFFGEKRAYGQACTEAYQKSLQERILRRYHRPNYTKEALIKSNASLNFIIF